VLGLLRRPYGWSDIAGVGCVVDRECVGLYTKQICADDPISETTVLVFWAFGEGEGWVTSDDLHLTMPRPPGSRVRCLPVPRWWGWLRLCVRHLAGLVIPAELDLAVIP